ncbi:MAG: hypothetical protein ACYSUP_12755 [Planctomycetota bacterium]
MQKPLSAIIIVHMNLTDRARKYEADKIVLLGMFAAGLIIAHLVTAYRYTGPRKAGAKVVAEVKSKGISSFFDNQRHRSFFLIKDVKDRTIGFTTDAFAPSAPPDKPDIQSTALLYIGGRYRKRQLTLFQSDGQFSTFSWKTELFSPAGRVTKEILLAEDGVLTITQSGQSTRQGYTPSPDSVPDLLLDLVFVQMLESGYKKIILETINSDGQTIETVVSETRTEGPGPFSFEPRYELNVTFLGGRGLSQHVYLDHDKRIAGTILKQDRIYLFERTTMEKVLRQIPEAKDYLAEMQKIPEPNLPQYQL